VKLALLHSGCSLLIVAAVILAGVTAQAQQNTGPTGMVWIPGGEYAMGTDEKEAYPAERPAHRVKVDG
jgi:formylglycine-generating enzyme required for sulfatase activity